MLNLLASRFADVSPVIVNAGQAKALEANLEALSASADAEKLLDLDAMARGEFGAGVKSMLEKNGVGWSAWQ